VRQPLRVGLAAGAVGIALIAAWTSWQPQRAVARGSDALAAAEAGQRAQARSEIEDAKRIDPLSVDLLSQEAAIDSAAGDVEGARRALQAAVRKQPANAQTWLGLAQFELAQGNKPQALSAVGSALFLDPRSPAAIDTYLQASRER
jgi:tetratricopeptide (TPR) repeat protein